MTQSRFGRTFRLSLIGSTLALALSACGSSGSTRIAAIGDVPGDSAGGGGGNTGDTGNGGGNTGGGNTGGGNTGGGNTGGGNTGGGGTGGGSAGGGGGTGSTGTTVPLAGPILVTAGNAVIGLGDKHAGLAGTVNGKLPVATPVTGTVTAVLRKSGQTLVDLGNGRSAVLNKAGGAVGRLVTIDLGTGRVIGAPGATALIGVAALTPTQLAGVSVANPAGAATTGVLGKVGTIVTGATGASGGLPAGAIDLPQPVTVIPAVTASAGAALGATVSTGAQPLPAVNGVLGKVTTKLGKK